MPHSYKKNAAAIYAESFATIRAEADLARFTSAEELVVVRMIHAAGMVGLAPFVQFTTDFALAARAALEGGAPILCDTRMVSEGITRTRLPADNQVICTLHDPQVRQMAEDAGNTRSAVSLELWRPYLAGAVVAIGNAPTALFHLLNMLEDVSCPRPAANYWLSCWVCGGKRKQSGADGRPARAQLYCRRAFGGQCDNRFSS